MNVIDLLKTDHAELEILFNRIDSLEEPELKRAVFEDIKRNLQLHMHLEETSFYPLFASEPEFEDSIRSSKHEHSEIKGHLQSLAETTDNHRFASELQDFIAGVRSHVRNEEDFLFPAVEKSLSEVRLNAIGLRVESIRQNLQPAA